MNDEHELEIDRIGTVDLAALARRFPDQTREIARLGELYLDDAESPDELRRLCELLHECGESREAEYLLRRNLKDSAARDLYRRLFDTAAFEALQQAVQSFAAEFGVDLALYQEWDVLDHEYESTPRPGQHSRPTILNAPCLVRISHTQREYVTADVIPIGRDKRNEFDFAALLNLRLQDGTWQQICRQRQE